MSGQSPTRWFRGSPPTKASRPGSATSADGRGVAARGLVPGFGLVFAVGLSACVETGDFGRVKPSVWNDTLGATGALAAARRGEPVSAYPLTDDEEDLRGRAWRFLVPAHGRAWFERALAELVATRIVPAGIVAEDPTAYHRALVGEGARSPASRYRRLSEDAAADARLIGPFADVARRVIEADRVRLRSLPYVHDLAPAEVANAEARVAENRCLTAWMAAGFDRRLESYRFSLEHLVIETPQADAVPAEQSLALLAQTRPELDRLGISPLAGAACAGSAGAVEVAPREPAPLPLVRKG